MGYETHHIKDTASSNSIPVIMSEWSMKRHKPENACYSAEWPNWTPNGTISQDLMATANYEDGSNIAFMCIEHTIWGLQADPLVSERQDGLFLNSHEAFPGTFEPSSELMELDSEMYTPPQPTYLDNTAQIEQGLISTISVKQAIIPLTVDQDTAYTTESVENENSSLASPSYGDATPVDEEPGCDQDSGLALDTCFGMVRGLKCALMW
jgi:hypothetical protein